MTRIPMTHAPITHAPMTHAVKLGFAALVLTGGLTVPQLVHAGVGACGDIHVEAEASCEVAVKGGCEVQCVPVSFEAACAAELYANCEGECSATASVDCSASCQADCTGSCEANPGSFDCRGSCNADCQGGCDASCSTGDSECRASCEATCSAECDVQCDATPPSASCDAKCEASCEGSCEAQANVDCQVSCQADGYIMCEADLQGGCEAQCQRPEGALFCDGQYVDHGNNLAECVAALQAQLNIEVDGYAEGQCSGNACQGEAGGSVSCSVDPNHEGGWAAAAGLFMVVLGGGLHFRRHNLS